MTLCLKSFYHIPYNAKYFFVLVPEEKEWQSDDMMIHYEIGAVKKDTAMTPAKNMCGWFSMVFKEAPTNVYMYLKNTPTLQLGLNGLWGNEDVATPVQLDLLYEAFDTNNLYFIPDDIDWPEGSEADAGWFVSDPGVPEAGDNSRCSFSLAAIIYDTDQDLNDLFSSDGDNVKDHTSGCVGVHPGLVKEDLGADNKPVFSGSADAVKCFQNASRFNTLFNHVPNVNEVQCYDMPFRHYGSDTRWGYDSDSTHYSNKGQELDNCPGNKNSATCQIGGFAPLEHFGDTFDANGNYTMALGSKTYTGTYTYNTSTSTMTMKGALGVTSLSSTVTVNINEMYMLFSADKILSIASSVSTVNSTLSSLLGNYNGLKLGWAMVKKQ